MSSVSSKLIQLVYRIDMANIPKSNLALKINMREFKELQGGLVLYNFPHSKDNMFDDMNLVVVEDEEDKLKKEVSNLKSKISRLREILR